MKKILFTGARSGIASKAINKLKNRYFIYVTVHTTKQLERVKEIYKNDKNIECFKLDVTNPKDREKLKELDIDILVNNAAISYGGSLIDISSDKVKQIFDVNVFGMLDIIQILIPNMLNKNSGKIINMASLSGIYPPSFIGAYASSKASIIKMTEVLKKELNLISDIKVSLIEPGFYHTGFNQVMFDNKNIDKFFKEVKDKINDRQLFITNFIEKKSFDSIVNKIIKCIDSTNPKFIYRAPFIQVLPTKIYSVFFT